MHKLFKTINKFNGNICFAGSTDSGDVVFECDYQNRSIDYALSTKLITDVCLKNEGSYWVAFSDQYLGLYSGGSLAETYLNTGISNVDKVVQNTKTLAGSGSSSIDSSSSSSSSSSEDMNVDLYLLNRTSNNLYKYRSGIIWTFSLPDYSLRHEGKIFLRESDGIIIYCNDTNIYLIRDDLTQGTLLGSLYISGSGELDILISNEFNPAYSYIRARMVSGNDLNCSSSSSSSSG